MESFMKDQIVSSGIESAQDKTTAVPAGKSLMRIGVIRSLLLATAAVLFLCSASFAQVGISVTIAPPVLPVYEQPVCPGDGYIWTPGYWAWADDYYWVPGTWVLAPEVGFFWTPCWWGWGGAAFIFHEGYWGPTIGFYGGINYGFGYFGHGYVGGRWDHGHFFYNTAVNRVDVNVIHNTYNKRVSETVNRVSYNGGRGGINAHPTSQEEAAAHDRHISPVAAQTEHAEAARNDPRQRLSANHGEPPVTATARPGAFGDRAVAPRGGGGGASGADGGGRPGTAVHPNDLPAFERTAPNTGNAKLDKKYQKEQDKLIQKQTQERQKLQQTQEREHQQLVNQKASQAKTAKLEQRHQQQTQQLQEKHTQQMHQLQQRQSSGGSHGGGGRH
jgi:hypothetical protein